MLLDYGFQLGGNPAVQTDEFAIDHAGKREQIKWVHEHLVHFLVVFKQAFFSLAFNKDFTFLFEIEEARQLSALVIASKEEDSVGEIYFDRVQKDDDLNWKWTSVHEVA